MGPITLFDKSFLEMLSIDQAALFDSLYSANICPVFLTEALADLSKTPPGNRTVEKIVSDLAMKSPPMHCYPNAEHTSLCLAELFGHSIEMRGVPAMTSGKLVEHGVNWASCMTTKRNWLHCFGGRKANSTTLRGSTLGGGGPP